MVGRRVLLPLLAAGAIALAGCDDPAPTQVNRRELEPPPGTGATGTACVVLRNKAPFELTGRIVLKSRERTTFRLARGETRRLCATGTLYGGNTVALVLTSFATLPIFSCYATVERAIDLTAFRKEDGWLYNANCR